MAEKNARKRKRKAAGGDLGGSAGAERVTGPAADGAASGGPVESPAGSEASAPAGAVDAGARPGADRGGPPSADDGPTVPLPTADDATVPLPADPADGRADDDTVPVRTEERVGVVSSGRPRWRLPRLTGANAMIGVLVALLGFTLVVQLRLNSTDASLETTRQEDLVRILSDLDAQEERVRQDITVLEESQRQLNSGAEGRQAALDAATRRADELGILAGTLPARGPGLSVSFMPVSKPIAASRVLDAVQELRGAGAEAMQITGRDGTTVATVRIISSTYFLDADGGISVSGQRLTGPYMIMVIGDPKTMQTALNIPGGVVASVSGDGGNVAIQEREVVDVSALSPQRDLQHARPVS